MTSFSGKMLQLDYKWHDTGWFLINNNCSNSSRDYNPGIPIFGIGSLYNCKLPNTFIGTRKLKMLIIQWHQSGNIFFTDEITIKIFNVCTVFETVCVCVCVRVCLN
jgi:hypothetical protein